MQYQLLVFTVLILSASSCAWNQFFDHECALCSSKIQNCASCDFFIGQTSTLICKTCLPGYYSQDQTTCGKCITGCRACADSSTCTLCFQGYYLSSGKCQPCQNTKCPGNDKCCTSATDSCSSCSASTSTSTSSGTSINVKKSWSNLSLLSIFALMSIIILLF